MERRSINPVSWSLKLGFDQAQLIEGYTRLLVCGGRDAVDADGNAQHPADMAAQLDLALDNLAAVLATADMTLANFDELVKHWSSLVDRFRSSDDRFATSLLGVTHTRAPRHAGGDGS
jgi:enamine deaminase RidA (YjgF/YER057c/UK114 family)